MEEFAIDSHLFKEFKAGHQAALGLLYARYRPHVYRLAFRILQNRAEAEDLTQEIFLALWRSNFDANRGTLRGYLTMVTRSRAIDRLRTWGTATKLIERVQQSWVMEPATNTLEHVMVEEAGVSLRQALTQLPARQRQVLEMAYYGGLSQSKIAATIEAPLGTVKSWMRQGLLTLRKQLAPQAS